jgi:hypothetical protein
MLSMQAIAKKVAKILKMDNKGQAGAAGSILIMLVSLIVVAVATLVINNVLAIAGLNSGLWTLAGLLMSVVFVILVLALVIFIVPR